MRHQFRPDPHALNYRLCFVVVGGGGGGGVCLGSDCLVIITEGKWLYALRSKHVCHCIQLRTDRMLLLQLPRSIMGGGGGGGIAARFVTVQRLHHVGTYTITKR